MKTKLIFPVLLCIGLSGLRAHAQGTFTETRTLQCGDTAWVGNLGYPSWNIASIVSPPKWGFAKLYGDFVPANLLIYEAPPCFTGSDTVIIACAHATQITCDTGIYVFNIECDSVIPTVFTYQVSCNDSIYVGNLSGWVLPQIVEGPVRGTAEIIFEPTDGAGVMYQPEPGFEGLDYVKVSTFQGELLYLFQVSCQASSVSEPVVSSLSFSPNPAGEFSFLQGSAPVSTLWIFNQQGMKISEQKPQNNKINLTGLPSGSYQVLATDGLHFYSGILVKAN